MEEQIRFFLDYLSNERAYAPNTIQAYRNDLTQFLNFAQVEKPYATQWSRIDKPLLVTFLSHLAAHEYTPASISRKTAVIRTFFHFLLFHKLIVDDPSAMLSAPRVEKKAPQILAHDEIERLLRCHGRHHTAKSLRDCAILELLYASGMRVTELVSLNVEDVNMHQAWVLCGRDQVDRREIPITQRAVDALHNYLQQGRSEFLPSSDEKALFLNAQGERLTRQGLWLIIKGCVKRAEIKIVVTPHTLRHSFAMHLLDSGEAVTQVQRLLGHSNVATTQAYVRFMGRANAARRDESDRFHAETTHQRGANRYGLR